MADGSKVRSQCKKQAKKHKISIYDCTDGWIDGTDENSFVHKTEDELASEIHVRMHDEW